MGRIARAWLGLLLAMTGAGGAARAQVVPSQSVEAALEQDAGAIAARLGVGEGEALHQLRLQQASGAVTDGIAARFTGRLTGIAIEHSPAFRIVVRLTGDDPVADEVVQVAGEPVTVTYVTGNPATLTGMVQAISTHQAEMRASLIGPPGLGIDQRSGELVAVVSSRDVAREGAAALRDRLSSLTGVPVRLRAIDQPAIDMTDVTGGARVVGTVPGDTRRFVCTTGFAVTDGTRDALTTAAHCPDTLGARDDSGAFVDLPFVGQWGWGNQDVQVNAAPGALHPAFFADTAKTVSRPVTGSRSRAGTRAGDIVCHRGERTGYSCSVVELTDFAPSGDLCGGACLSTWTTVAGPTCKGGDSGSPVFLGTTAYGILKGGSYRPDGSCAFYFYMSTDYLPTGWRLLTTEDGGSPPGGTGSVALR